jgi:hypothetical protein
VETVSQGEISRTPLEQAAAGRQKAGQREEKMTAKHKGCGKGGRAASAAAAFLLFPAEALAHASDRGHILLLPTGHYLAGGAAAVALTFLVLAFVPQRALDRLFFWRMPLGALPLSLRFPASALSFAFLVFLVAAGFLGSGDPLTNPLPLMVWAMFWVGLTLAQAAFGDVWRFLDPWYAPWRVLAQGERDAARPARLLAGAFAVLRLRLVRARPSRARRSRNPGAGGDGLFRGQPRRRIPVRP